MTTWRGVLGTLTVMMVVGCSGGGGPRSDLGAGGTTGNAADDAAAAVDAEGDADAGDWDAPADFAPDARGSCPANSAALAPADAALLIDDFGGLGPLDGRRVTRPAFSVSEQFDATVNAQFDNAPGINPSCGAAAAGAAHIAGMPADAGATFAIVFSTGAGGVGMDFVDGSGYRGITFRAALGNARSSRLFSLRAGVAGSTWSYTKDISVEGLAWSQIDVLWSELNDSRAPAAPPFDPAKLNQLVLSLTSGAAVDILLDDIAFLR